LLASVARGWNFNQRRRVDARPQGSDRARMNIMAISNIAALGDSVTQAVSGRSSPSAPSASTSASGPSFAQTLGQVVSDAVGTLQAGEAAAIQGVQGSLAPFKVVESIMGAQRTLSQALAIRDKAVSAYQEITRMAI
jgi:flagellar hook-basal body complex protein FliE